MSDYTTQAPARPTARELLERIEISPKNRMIHDAVKRMLLEVSQLGYQPHNLGNITIRRHRAKPGKPVGYTATAQLKIMVIGTANSQEVA